MGRSPRRDSRPAEWRRRAHAVIARVLDELGPGRRLKTKLKALRAAYPFGERRYWPYKVWCSEVRFALGLQQRPSRIRVPGDSPGQMFLFTQDADVTEAEQP